MNDLTVKIEEMMKDFNAKNEVLVSKIENLKKSEDSIKDSFNSHFEEIQNIIKDYYYQCRNILDDLYKKDMKYMSFRDNKSNWNTVKIKSLITGKDISCSFFIKSRFSEFGGVNFDIGITFENIPSYKSYSWYYFGNNEDIDINQAIVEWYLSGYFEKSLMFIMQDAIENYLNKQQEEIKRLERVIENSHPITSNADYWSDYIMYLLKWSSEHTDKQFSGMSPACYDEWLDNEMGEE